MLPAQLQDWVHKMNDPSLSSHARENYLKLIEDCMNEVRREVEKFHRDTKIKLRV